MSDRSIRVEESTLHSQVAVPSAPVVLGYSIQMGYSIQKFSVAGIATTDAGGCIFGNAPTGIVNEAINFKFQVDPTIPAQLYDIPGIGRLRKPISITVERESGSVMVTAHDLDITESGITLDDALEAFFAFFREDLEYWKSTNDQLLTEDAKALKSRYLEYVA
jgi:hypothetical protein